MTITREQGGPPSWFEQEEDPIYGSTDDGLIEELSQAASSADPLEGLNDASVRVAAAGDRPTIDPTPELTVELPRGLRDPANPGVWRRRAEIRELTGRDEEHLARYKTEEEMLDAIIALGTESIGGLDLSKSPVSSRSSTLGSLLVGERMMLYMGIVRATFGNEKELTFTCGSCETENNTTILLDTDFPVDVPEDIDREVFEFKTRSGEQINYRPVSGADVLAINKKGSGKLSTSELNSRMLESIILNVDGEVPYDMREYVRDLGMLDRSQLLADVAKRQPSIDWMLKIECVGCHEEVSVPANWASLFRP